jgi:hypothetical protein
VTINQQLRYVYLELNATFLATLDATESFFMQNQCDSVKPKQTRMIKPTRRSVSGIFPFRGETAIPYESTLERDFLIRKEFSLYVLDIIPQPVQVPLTSNNGQIYTYTPDFSFITAHIKTLRLQLARDLC